MSSIENGNKLGLITKNKILVWGFILLVLAGLFNPMENASAQDY